MSNKYYQIQQHVPSGEPPVLMEASTGAKSWKPMAWAALLPSTTATSMPGVCSTKGSV